MRYHLGLGVGHAYAHGQAPTTERTEDAMAGDDLEDVALASGDTLTANFPVRAFDYIESSSDEDDIDNEEHGHFLGSDGSGDDGEEGGRDESDDEEYLAVNEMYR